MRTSGGRSGPGSVRLFPPVRLSPRAIAVAVASICLALFFLCLSWYANPLNSPTIGWHLYTPQGAASDITTGEAREVMKIALESQSILIQVATGGFAAAAFLLTYHRERASVLSRWCAGLLSLGLLSLLSALLFALFAREALLMTLTWNSYSPGMEAVVYSRRLFYGALIIAVISFGLFALEVAFVSPGKKAAPGP
jgi:hypothetical protein